jgi:putative hydrolase of the HAD superfamily
MVQGNQMIALVLDFGGVISCTVSETQAANEAAPGLPTGTLTWRGPFDSQSDFLWQAMQANDISECDHWYARAAETEIRAGEVWTSLPQFPRGFP